MAQMAEHRPWLIKLHCVNHRLELTLKEAIRNSAFDELDNDYSKFVSFLQNSGKIKEEIKQACLALDIQHYELPKMKGTRFIGHRRNAYKAVLEILPGMEQYTLYSYMNKANNIIESFRSL